VKLTRKVRRGFAMMIEHDLERRVELIAEHNRTRPRAERYTARELEDLAAAAAWIKHKALAAAEGEPEAQAELEAAGSPAGGGQ
jgi:hypothetical protein